MKYRWPTSRWKQLLFSLSPFPRQMLGELYHHCWLFGVRLNARFNPWSIWRRMKYRGRTDLKLNIGCARFGRSDWVNVDCYPSEGVDLVQDCRYHLPFDDGSVQMIFCEHMFEHLMRPFETDPFLAECHRVLKPGGALRIIVPDFGAYMHAYVRLGPLPAPGKVVLDDSLHTILVDGDPDPARPIEYETRMEAANVLSHGFWHHKYIYDGVTLARYLTDAGFVDASVSAFGQSRLDGLAIDSPQRAWDSLYVEASR